MATDFSALDGLYADLTAAPQEVRLFVRKAFQVTSHYVRDDARRSANRTGLRRYAADITYETEEKTTRIRAEIGPTIGDSGSFGFVEDANGGVRSAPQHALRDALKANEPDFVDGIEKALADGLEKAVGG